MTKAIWGVCLSVLMGTASTLFMPAFAQTAPEGAPLSQPSPPPGSDMGPGTEPPDPENATVMERSRPEYDAKGIPLGGFRLFPTMDVTATYDDNVRYQPSGTADWYFVEAPAFRLQSQWGLHFLELFGGLNNYNYAKDTGLNLTDWDIGGDGRLDVSHAFTVSMTGSFAESHEALSSPNTIGLQASPNRYYQPHGELTLRYQPDRLGFVVGEQIDRFDWQNTPELGGGTLINTDRNETEYQAYAKAFYDFSPGYSAFVRTAYDDRTFDLYADRTGVHRDSVGYRVDGGVDLQLSHLIRGEFYAGWLDQHYAQNVANPLRSISGLDFGASLDWLAQQDLTLHLMASHTIQDVVLSNVSAASNDNVSLAADYEAAHNIIIQGYGSYTHSHFGGTARTDEYPSAGIKGKYLLNEYLSAYVGYDYSNRSSNFPGINFNANLLTFGITGHI